MVGTKSDYDLSEVKNIVLNMLSLGKESGNEYLKITTLSKESGIDPSVIRSASKILEKENLIETGGVGATPAKRLSDGVDISKYPLPKDFSFEGVFKSLIEGDKNKVTVSSSANAETKKPANGEYSSPLLSSIMKAIKDVIDEGNPAGSDIWLFDSAFKDAEAKGATQDQIKAGLLNLATKGLVTEDNTFESELSGFIFTLSESSKKMFEIPESELLEVFGISGATPAVQKAHSAPAVEVQSQPASKSPEKSESLSAAPVSSDAKAGSDLVDYNKKLAVLSTIMNIPTQSFSDMNGNQHREVAPYYIYAWMLKSGGKDFNKGVVAKTLEDVLVKSKPTIATAVINAANLGLLKEDIIGKRNKYNPAPISEIEISDSVLKVLKDIYMDIEIDDEFVNSILPNGFDAVEQAMSGNQEEQIADEPSIVQEPEVQSIPEDTSVISESAPVSQPEQVASKPASTTEDVKTGDLAKDIDDVISLIQSASSESVAINSNDIVSALASLQSKVADIESENKMWRESFSGVLSSAKEHFGS